MEPITFQPLVTLATKPNPEKYNPIKIKLGSDDKEKEEQPKVNIIDRTKENKVDRKRVMEKIKKNLIVQTTELVPDKEETKPVPVITNKKIKLDAKYVIPVEEEKEEEEIKEQEQKEEKVEEAVQEETKEQEEKVEEAAQEETKEDEENDDIIDVEKTELDETEENLEDDFERIVQQLEKDEPEKEKNRKNRTR